MGHDPVQSCLWRLRQLVLLVAVMLCLAPAAVAGEGWSPAEVSEDWLGFITGMAGSIAAHELGHVLVARTHGYYIEHDGLSLTFTPAFRSRSDHLRVASAGFQGQWLAAEAAFAAGDKWGNLGAGLVCGHLATSLAYLAILKNHKRGDTVGMAKASGLSVDQVALLAAIPAVLDSWRLFGRDVPNWVPGLSLGLKGAGIAAVWTY